MDFRWPPGSAPSVPGGSPPAWFSHPQGPLPPPLREHIIREAVTRRLNEEWAMGVHGGFRPGPFFAPDRLMPPPHAPMPMPMHPLPHAPPPVPFEGFGAWQGPGPCRHAGFGERTPFPREERRASPPRPDPKRKVKLPEIEPSSGTPEVLSPKVPMMKRKADANAATTVPKKVQKLAEDWSAPSEAGLNEHLGGRKHKAKLAQCGVSKAIKDDKNCLQTTTGNENSTDPCDAPKKICMLVDSATCEASLNEHLGGRNHKAKLALCGASKAIKDDKNSLHMTTGNKDSTDPCDAPKKMFLLVDGEMHEVVRKNDYLWCDRCRVRCYSNVVMAGHLRSKKHSKLNKVWTSIKAVRTNTDTKEGLPSCGSQVNTNGSTEIPAAIEGDGNMTTEVDESGPVENPVQKEIHLRSKKHSKLNKVWTSIKAVRTNTDTKEGLPSCGIQVNTNGPTEIPAVIEGDINMTTEVDESGPVENPVQKEIHPRSKKHSTLNEVWTSIKAVRTNTDTKNQIHPRSKKHGKLNKVWTSIKAVRTNTDTKEGLSSCGSQVPSMKRKADANAATTVPKKVQKLAKDWSCALCQLSAPSEAGLNVHLAGRKHKAKLAQCGVSKAIKDDKNCSQTTTGNENSTDPCDAPKQICMLVDGEVHVVVRKNNYLWCYRCRVRCNDNATMACHLRCKKHSKWTSINAVRTNNDTKEGLPSCGSQALSSKPKVPTVKRKADANAATTVPKKVQKLAKDWSCALCQVSAPCEAALNEHLGGRKHKAKLAQCGVSKTIKDGKNCSQTTTGNENSTDPCDASKKICMPVDDAMHEVVRKENYLWCDHCRVRCDNYATMACHLRCKKQSILTKVCSSIKAVRTNTDTKEGLPSCGSQVNTNGSIEISAVIGGDINMTTAVDESGPVENPVRKEITRMATIKAVRTNTDTKEGLPSCGSRLNTNGSTEIPAVIEGDINMTTTVDERGPVENPVRKEITRMATIKAVRTNTDTKEGLPSSCGSQVNTNGSTEIPAVIEGDINMTTAVDESGPVENPVQKEIIRMATIWAMFSS